jgi:uncharacterized protein YjbI with pentapeptide repeats
MTQDELNEILLSHYAWMLGFDWGEKADLRNCDLRDLNFRGTCCVEIDFTGSDITGADFEFANLEGAEGINSVLSDRN